MVEKTIVIVAKTKDAKKNIKDVADEVKQTNKAATQLTNSFDKATGGLISKSQGAVSSIRNLGNGLKLTGSTGVKAFKALKIAIASTGIGLLLVAFGSLITFFTETQRGADKIKQAFAGVRAAVSAITDRISGLGESLTKLFTGDWRGALDGAKDAFKGLGDEIREEVTAAIELEKALQRIKDREIDLIISNAKLRKAIAEDRLLAEDRTKTMEERLAALDRVLKAEDDLLNQRLEIAREEARISQDQINLGESTRAELEANAQLQARVIDLETQSLESRRRAFTRRQALLQEQTAQENAAVKEQFDTRQKFNEAVKVQDDLAVARFQNKIAAETSLVKHGMNTQLKIYQAGKKEEQKIDKITSEQKLGLAQQTFGAIAGILGRNSKVGKAAAIAQATINTYQGITQVWKNETTLPEPFGTIQKVVASGVALASGLQAVRSINQTPVPVIAQGGFGGGGGGGAPSAVSAPPQINTVGASGISQLAETISSQSDKPVKAYVVAGEITSAQSLERNTIEQASI